MQVLRPAVSIKVPGHGPLPANARVMIVGEAPGADEEAFRVQGRHEPRPFVGRGGQLLDEMLTKSGIGRAGCYVTNVCKYRPPANKIEEWWTDNAARAKRNALTHRHGDHWMHAHVAEGLAELPGEIERAAPEVIVALGNLALWALTGEVGIGNWRGSEMWYAGVPAAGPWDWAYKAVKGGPKQVIPTGRSGAGIAPIAVVPTYHPAYVLRVWEWKAPVLHDLRARVAAKMGHPGRRIEPERNIVVAESADHAWSELDKAGYEWAKGGDLTCDVETKRGQIMCVGLGWSDKDALVIPFVHPATMERFYTSAEDKQLSGALRSILAEPGPWKIGNQNWNYDRQYFIRDPAFGFHPRMDFDTMIAQHLLLPGTPKDLAYLASMYCRHYRFWKEDGKEIFEGVDEARLWNYNGLDAVRTWEIWQTQKRLLAEARFL